MLHKFSPTLIGRVLWLNIQPDPMCGGHCCRLDQVPFTRLVVGVGHWKLSAAPTPENCPRWNRNNFHWNFMPLPTHPASHDWLTWTYRRVDPHHKQGPTLWCTSWPRAPAETMFSLSFFSSPALLPSLPFSWDHCLYKPCEGKILAQDLSLGCVTQDITHVLSTRGRKV